MLGKFGLHALASAVVVRTQLLIALLLGLATRFRIGGVFLVECFDAQGKLRWSQYAVNGVTDAGIAHILNVYFRGTSPVTTWYLGLINNSGYTALAASDTSGSHSGWAEAAGSNYSNSNRVTWSPGSPSSGAIVNSTSSDFNMTATVTIKGLFLISDNTKGGTTGTLFSTALFTGGNQAVNDGDTLKVTYTMSAASS